MSWLFNWSHTRAEVLIKVGEVLSSLGQFVLGVGCWLIVAGVVLLSEFACPHNDFIRRGRGILCLGCGRIEEPGAGGVWKRTSNRTWED